MLFAEYFSGCWNKLESSKKQFYININLYLNLKLFSWVRGKHLFSKNYIEDYA